ncbi:carbohydrate ABC transporter permease [Taklimakanibacter deserti]|uniref:carbohydrate ABC transporter permease n=1 Tax=Taklimakanibacter deserti TaxID=2267839 RepID=UPI000E65D15F
MAFVGPGFLYILLIVIYPLGFSLWASFTNMRLTSPIARFVGLDTYAQALGNDIFRESLIVTGLFLVTVVALEFILGFALAFSFSRMRRTHPAMRALLLLPVMATPVSVGLIWKLMLNSDFGIITSWGELLGFGRVLWLSDPVLAFMSIVIMDVWQWTPFMFLILLAGLEGLPREPLESAAVDGASPLQSLIHVTLPLMKRIIMIAVVFRLMFAIATFDTVYVLTKGGPARATDLVTLFIQREGFVNLNIAFASAVSFLVLIAVLIATTLLFKRELSDAK